MSRSDQENPMVTAVYYPHTTIRSRDLVKTALLLWDSVECIVPRVDWKMERPFKEKPYNEALEMVVRPHVPKQRERSHAHQDVAEFVREGLSRFLFDIGPGGRYGPRSLLHPEKFLEETWCLLEEVGLARWDEIYADYGVPPALALLMMSSLADACAGTQKQKVTDRVHAYSLLEKAKATLLGAPFVEGLDASQVAPELDRLVTVSMSVLDARKIPINKLLALRKREAKGRSADYRKMRLNYLNGLRTYIHRMLKEARSPQDVAEIEHQFKAEMRDDLLSLKQELSLATLEALFSKEMVLAAIAIGGAFVEPISGLTNLAATLQGIGVIPLVKTRINHKKQRREALLGHKISWLYLTQQRTVTFR